LLSVPSRAELFFNLSLPIEVADAVNNYSFANPPLPLIISKGGEYRTLLQPFIFDGKVKDEPNHSATFKGQGLGAAFTYAFSERWGVYTFIIGNSMTGDFVSTEGQPGSNQNRLTMNGARGTNGILGVGAVYRGIFFGPAVFKQNVQIPVRETSAAGALIADYDLKVDRVAPGAFLGAQGSWDLNRWWAINPYIIAAVGAGKAPFKIGEVRRNVTTVGDFSNMVLADGKGNVTTAGIAASAGLNVTLRPYSLSANITAPILQRYLLKGLVGGPKKMEIGSFAISWAFGKYEK